MVIFIKRGFADFYDIMMNEVDYDGWVNLIDKLIKDKTNSKNILEIGCGTGEIAVRLNEKGYNVTGIDNSDSMLRIAKSKYPKLNLKKIDMKHLKEIEKYDTVISVFDTINYLNNLEELKLSFENIKKSLKKNGIFIFDVLNRKMMNYMFEGETFADDRENITIIWKHNYDKILDLDEVKMSFFLKKEKNNYERYDEKFLKKIFLQKDIKKICEEIGFNIIFREINTEIAGPRIIYILQRAE